MSAFGGIPVLERQSSAESQESIVSDYSYDYNDEEEEDEEEDKEEDEDNLQENAAFFVISLDQVLNTFICEARVVSDLCNISESSAMMMLRESCYNKDAALSSYFDKVAHDAEERKASKYLPATVTYGDPHGGTPEEFQMCFVCCDDSVKSEDFISLGCKHSYCRECWTNYLESRITEGEVFNIRCMDPECQINLSYDCVKEIASDAVFAKYKKFMGTKVASESKKYTFCPMEGCGACSELTSALVGSTVDCQSCSHAFCLKCQEEAHEPASCEAMKLWLKLQQEDGMTTKWISAHTKDCPKCKKPIEKNGGCNHMSCGQCRAEFCWLCLGNWSNHSSCSAHKTSANETEERQRLNRYVHFWTRFAEHGKSVKNEKQLMERMLAKGKTIESKTAYEGVSPSEYLRTGMRSVMKCRRVLRFTYIHAYYMEDETEQRLFEYMQEELEKAVEELSYRLEHKPKEGLPISNAAAIAVKQAQHILEAGYHGVDVSVSGARLT